LARSRLSDPGPRQEVEETKLSRNSRGLGAGRAAVGARLVLDPLIGVGKKRAGRELDGREWNEYPREERAPQVCRQENASIRCRSGPPSHLPIGVSCECQADLPPELLHDGEAT